MNATGAKSPSLAGRAAAAVSLMIGFYVLALGLAAGLLAIPIWEWQSLGKLHVKAALGCTIGAGIILWAVFPRRDKFPPPGVPLTKETQPRLFDAIESVARDTGQAMPAEVYLIPDVNAFVAQRGGVMGFFSRRVMGIGLPLLRVFDVDQVRAVLAHEFGHFHGGDTKLGPWVYKTSGAIGRTVSSLAKAESILLIPFRWYGLMFLRITQDISRAQEYAADRLAARVVGAEPLASGLKMMPGIAALYGPYLEREYLFVLNAGRRPPFASGFQLFMRSDAMQKAAREICEQDMKEDAEKPHDTHPPTRLRIEALTDLPARASATHDTRPAIDLLADRDGIECEVLAFMTGNPSVKTLPRIEWRNVGEEVLMKGWRDDVARWRASPKPPAVGSTLGALPELARNAAEIGKACAPPKTHKKDHASVGTFVIGAFAAVALHDAGFAIDSHPGSPVILERNGHRFAIVEDARALVGGALAPDAWRTRCEQAGVADLRVG
jgi:Zn-dependent protease with chaperone function